MVVLLLVFLTGSFWNVCLSWFTRTVGARRHKLGGWKQQNRILWQFWRPDVPIGGARRAVQQGRRAHAFLSAPGGCLALVHPESAAAPPHALALTSRGSLPSPCLCLSPRHGSREGFPRDSPWGFPGGKEPARQRSRLKR